MAHLDLSPSEDKPAWLRTLLTMRMNRAYNMLVAAAIASMTIVAVAAAMMTRI